MPRNLAINIIINSMQTLLNADSLTVNIIQGQRNIRPVIMTAIDRLFNYFIGQYVSRTEPFIKKIIQELVVNMFLEHNRSSRK
jgi:hypothetical protein